MAPADNIDEVEIATDETMDNFQHHSRDYESHLPSIPEPPSPVRTGVESGVNPPPPRFDVASHLSGVFGGITDGEDSKLHVAARRGDHETARLLLSGRPTKKKQLVGLLLKNPEFLAFAREEFENEITEEGKEVAKEILNARNRLGATPLWIAASAGHTETVRALCECGANLETPDIKGQTPLFAAAKYNNVDCVKALLEAGANPEGSPCNISTPIYIAARENLPDVVRLLIEYGADVNGRYADLNGGTNGNNMPYVGSVPLYMTIVYQNFECFRILILNGAELHAATNDRGFGTSLVTGVLRHQCDARYLKLIALCGGIRHGDKKGIDEAIVMFRQFTHGMASARKECLAFLDYWNAQPMTLTQLCRICIRQQMGQKRLKYFEDLTVPRSFHRYVLFSEHLK